ncbi:MAG TPA: glycosyltransferase family 39 protein [Steroidobacteraceae bacterium]
MEYSRSTPRSGSAAHHWAVRIMVALAPIWLICILDRGLWTPDEPREADIAWRMSQQSDRTLPELAGTPFLEKPPLSYWMSAAGLHFFGESAAAARSSNILYAALTALAVGALALAMSDAAAALIAALVTATTIIVFRVTVWLAPDACLLAGCAIALLGTFIGYTSPTSRRKLLGYCLMHAGAAMGFMAKSAPGWMAPVLALGAIIAWERRWSELARWELYAGFIIQGLIIGPWIWAVTRTAHGSEALLALFWHNVVGRFTKISAPTALDYSTGHKNTPGKYFIELPVYLLPWTLLVVAALRRAWSRVRGNGPDGTAWRFAVGASLPFLIVLSLAATARDIYSAPALLGLGVLVALWLREAQLAPTHFDMWAIRGTRWLVTLIALVFAGLPAGLATVDFESRYVLGAVGVLAVSLAAMHLAAKAQDRGNLHGSFGWTCTAYVAAVCVMAIATFPTIDRWQDLSKLAGEIHTDSQHTQLALLDPDETTIAMLDDELRTRFTILSIDPAVPGAPAPTREQVVSDWFNTRGPTARVLVLLPGHAPGELTRLVGRFRTIKPPDDGAAGELRSHGIATLERRYELPQGRRYALLRPPRSSGLSSRDGSPVE